MPTLSPTSAPTAAPTTEPTPKPTEEPTRKPTAPPTAPPTEQPTVLPTAQPTAHPTHQPSLQPTVGPTQEPTSKPTNHPAPHPPPPGGGFCYSGRTTLSARKSPRSAKTEDKRISELKEGDEVQAYRKIENGKDMDLYPFFTRIVQLPHQETTQPTYKITTAAHSLRGKLRGMGKRVDATASHTFIRCTDQSLLVKASELKVGDCLITGEGPRLVTSSELLPEEAAKQHHTYSVVTEGGEADLIAVGGLLAHATEHKSHGHAMA